MELPIRRRRLHREDDFPRQIGHVLGFGDRLSDCGVGQGRLEQNRKPEAVDELPAHASALPGDHFDVEAAELNAI